MKNILLIVFSILIQFITYGQKDSSWTSIGPENPLIQYEGRIDFSNPSRPSFCYPGVTISFSYEGTGVELQMNELESGGDYNTNSFQIILDGKSNKVWKMVGGKNKIQINAGKGNHTIKIFKRTECSVGKCEFSGIKLKHPGKLLPFSKTEQVIEFIGDSYTCGYGNEISVKAPPDGNPNTGFHSENENNYMAWGAIAARTLNASYHCVAYSGRGIYRNNTGATSGILPEIYERVFPDEDKKWIRNSYTPDFVVIHLGTNDFYPESKNNPVDSAAFCSSYVNFVKKLRSDYTNAKIICVLSNGLSDWWPEGKQARTRCSSYLKSVVKMLNDPNLYYLDIGIQQAPYGEDWHPSIATHEEMAEKLVMFIRQIR